MCEDTPEVPLKPFKYSMKDFAGVPLGFGHIDQGRWDRVFGSRNHARHAGRSRYRRCDRCGQMHWDNETCGGVA